ncbi:MAG: hypothetical protein JKX94_12500 [Sneathiella sp.]|nr:hypothetical protein [Sneathiella sp.]
MTKSETKKYWLDQPGNINKLFYCVIALACLVAIPDILALFHILYDKHPKTGIEEIPVFYGLYSMIAFLTLLIIANAVRSFLKRGEDYYD